MVEVRHIMQQLLELTDAARALGFEVRQTSVKNEPIGLMGRGAGLGGKKEICMVARASTPSEAMAWLRGYKAGTEETRS